MKKGAFLLLFTLLSGFISIQTTFACSCMPPASPDKEMEKADLVFQATVTQVQSVDENIDFGKKNEITFDVKGSWKGTVDKPVYTQQSSAACGYNFQEGSEYVVYAWEDTDNDNYYVNLCSRTNLADNAEEDIQAFGAFQDQVDNNSGEPESPIEETKVNIGFIIIGFILIFGLGFFAFLRSHKNK